MEAEEEAVGEAVVVEAFGKGIENEMDVLAVVAVEGRVVQKVGEGGGGERGISQSARDRLG